MDYSGEPATKVFGSARATVVIIGGETAPLLPPAPLPVSLSRRISRSKVRWRHGACSNSLFLFTFDAVLMNLDGGSVVVAEEAVGDIAEVLCKFGAVFQ